MSNYPPPYPGQPAPPSPYAGPPAAYYGPPPAAGSPAARRAGSLMFVLGPVVLLMGGCFVFIAAALPAMSRNPSTAQQVDDLRAKMPMPNGVSLETVLTVAGILIGLPGIGLLVLAPFVRRGRTWAIVTTLIVDALVLLWLALNVLVAVAHVGSDPSNLFGGCLGVVFLAAFGLLLAWLIGALRNRGTGVDPYHQYLSQYYYHQQMAQAYGTAQQPPGYGQGGGYGYGATPPPPPTDAAPPPAG